MYFYIFCLIFSGKHTMFANYILTDWSNNVAMNVRGLQTRRLDLLPEATG